MDRVNPDLCRFGVGYYGSQKEDALCTKKADRRVHSRAVLCTSHEKAFRASNLAAAKAKIASADRAFVAGISPAIDELLRLFLRSGQAYSGKARRQSRPRPVTETP